MEGETSVLDGLPYTLKIQPRSNRVWLRVYRDGRVMVSVPSMLPKQEGEQFLREHLDWVKKKVSYAQSLTPKFKVISAGDYEAHKHQALELVQTKVAHFNEFYQHSFKTIRIKDQKTKWGSCSRQGNLNFNYKILFLPECMADYLVVHELCHLKELNHSRRFWCLVGQTVPNHADIRAEMRFIKFTDE